MRRDLGELDHDSGEPIIGYAKTIEIRWRDIDAFQHLNNAVYLTYLEECRDEFLEGLVGESSTWDFVIARIAIDFRRELRLEDGFADVMVRVVRIGTSSVTLREEVRRRGGVDVAAEAETVLVARDRVTGRSRPLRDAERAACEAELEQEP